MNLNKPVEISEGSLKKVFDEAYDMIVNRHSFGPMDGGCYMFARAVNESVPGSSIAMVIRDGVPDHYMVKLPGEDSPMIDYMTFYFNKESTITHMIEEFLPMGTNKESLDVVQVKEIPGENEDLVIDMVTIEKMKSLFSNLEEKIQEEYSKIINENPVAGVQFEEIDYEIGEEWRIALADGSGEGRETLTRQDNEILDKFLETIPVDALWEFSEEKNEFAIDEVSGGRRDTYKAKMFIPLPEKGELTTLPRLLKQIEDANEMAIVKERWKDIACNGLPLNLRKESIRGIDEYIDIVIPLLKKDIRKEETISSMIDTFEKNVEKLKFDPLKIKSLVALAEIQVIHGLYPIKVAAVVQKEKNRLLGIPEKIESILEEKTQERDLSSGLKV